jgi:hypothetical protein
VRHCGTEFEVTTAPGRNPENRRCPPHRKLRVAVRRRQDTSYDIELDVEYTEAVLHDLAASPPLAEEGNTR